MYWGEDICDVSFPFYIQTISLFVWKKQLENQITIQSTICYYNFTEHTSKLTLILLDSSPDI